MRTIKSLRMNLSENRLNRDFFNQCTLKVAKQLLGKILVYKQFSGVITETEAYKGFRDPASHAAKGKTKRTEIMFGTPGHIYVYLIYGMYYCLNIVTERENYPAAVLIRGLKIINPQNENQCVFLDGPGKICRYLGIDKNNNGIDSITSNELYIANPRNSLKIKHVCTPRIGINVGQEKLWRFVIDV